MILRRRVMVLGGGDIEGYVDLGLPSGKLWAKGNITKDSQGNYSIGEPEDYGTYFSWGNVDGHNPDDGYNFSSDVYDGTTGNTIGWRSIPVDSTYDAARARLGGDWKIPSRSEFQELISNTVVESGTLNSVDGFYFYKKVNGQKVPDVYIFMPNNGRMNGTNLEDAVYWGNNWTSTHENDTYAYRYHSTINSSADADTSQEKYYGCSIRAVFKPMFSITITLTGDSVSGITVTVTDSEGISHFGTTDSNGLVRLGGVVAGSAKISAVGYVFTPYSINVNSSSRTFTIGCEYAFVDLGLPSGLLWAKGNLCKDSQGNYYIGAPTDWGTYVSWGNIIGHNEGEGYDFSDANYNSTPGHSVAANIPSNDAAHDIALATLCSPWHLPTKEDYQELYDNTDPEWVADYNGTGVAGRKFMKKSDHSVYVFFPASGRYYGAALDLRGTNGFYWSASFLSAYAYYLRFDSSGVNPQNSSFRYRGFTVRPVSNL